MRVRVRRILRQKAHVRAKCVRGNISKCEVRACEVKYIAPNILVIILKLLDWGCVTGVRMTGGAWLGPYDWDRMTGVIWLVEHDWGRTTGVLYLGSYDWGHMSGVVWLGSCDSRGKNHIDSWHDASIFSSLGGTLDQDGSIESYHIHAQALIWRKGPFQNIICPI